MLPRRVATCNALQWAWSAFAAAVLERESGAVGRCEYVCVWCVQSRPLACVVGSRELGAVEGSKHLESDREDGGVEGARDVRGGRATVWWNSVSFKLYTMPSPRRFVAFRLPIPSAHFPRW